MESQALVKLALKTLSCNQSELAKMIGVSPTQITKWKKGEHMSLSMGMKFDEILNIKDRAASTVALFGSLENAIKWEKLFVYLAEVEHDMDGTAYIVAPLVDDPELLSIYTYHTLTSMGVELPEQFPDELDFDYENVEESDDDKWEVFRSNPYASLISDIYGAYIFVYGFYMAFIYDLIQDDDLKLDMIAVENIESCLMDLAACKIDVDAGFAPKYKEFEHTTLRNYYKWIGVVKNKAIRSGFPLGAELTDIIHDSPYELGDQVDAETMGKNEDRIHPDIYINEALTGIRTIIEELQVIKRHLNIAD